MSYRINLLPSAEDDLNHLDKPAVKLIVNRLNWLSENLENISPVMLSGRLKGLYKYRAGDYRIIYDFSHADNLIRVHFIGHRKDIYKTK